MIPHFMILAIQGVALLALVAALPPRKASWWGWSVSALLLPSMAEFYLPGGAAIDPRAVALMVLPLPVVTAWMNDARSRLRGWRLVDVLVLGVVLSQIITAAMFDPNPRSLVLRPMVGFGLPYVLGRFAMVSGEEVVPFLKVICLVTAALIFLTVCEAATGINVFTALGARELKGMRLGLTRANGPMRHPLYLAMSFLVLSAPVLSAAALARAGRGPGWWTLMPWLLPLGAMATISRGPTASILVAIGLYIILGSRAWRVPLLILWVGGAAFAMSDSGAIRRQLEAVGEGARAQARVDAGKDLQRVIIIDNKEYSYSSIEHRTLTFKVYEKPLERMGPFGYGPRREGVRIDESLKQRFSSIDNTYLSYTLSFGRVGMGLLIATMLAALAQMGRILLDRGDPRATSARAFFSMLLAVCVAMYGVSLNHDHAAVLMYFVGVSTNLAVLRPSPAGRAARLPARRVAPAPGPVAVGWP